MPLVTLLFGYLIVLNSTIEELWVRVRRMKMSERTMMSIRKCAPERLSDCMRGLANRAVKPAAIKAGGSSCRRNCARLIRSEQGGPLIEFAFVLPLMMICLTGMFTFGVAIYNALVLTQATGAGAQRLQQIRSTTADPCADTLSAIESAAPTLKPASISLSLSINGGTAVTGSSCASSTSSLQSAQGLPVTVSTTYPCTLAVYGLNLGSCQLAAKVTEYEY